MRLAEYPYLDGTAGLFKGSVYNCTSGEDRGAEGAEGVGCRRGVPLPTGRGLCPLPRKKIDFGSQYGEFWCILDFFLQFSYLFYTQNRCNLVLLPIFVLIFRLKKDLQFIFLHFGVGKSFMPPVQYWSGLQNALHYT